MMGCTSSHLIVLFTLMVCTFSPLVGCTRSPLKLYSLTSDAAYSEGLVVTLLQLGEKGALDRLASAAGLMDGCCSVPGALDGGNSDASGGPL
jgi:hypothetical protein